MDFLELKKFALLSIIGGLMLTAGSLYALDENNLDENTDQPISSTEEIMGCSGDNISDSDDNNLDEKDESANAQFSNDNETADNSEDDDKDDDDESDS